ncbi:MAG: DHA2 family efflux MFS transporter permease subunit, partial [Gemmatimonadaceae bacterium]
MSAPVALASPTGRWIVAAAVLGSGAVFLESTVVSVALPAMGRDLGLGLEGVQWVMNGFLLSLSALMLLGGALGDAYGHRIVFAIGLAGFAAASLLCTLAPNIELLTGCRLLQGGAGALLVPNSLAILDTTFAEEDRGTAIGQWAAWSAVSTALGPLLGGWLVDAASWRWVFASIVPLALGAAWIAVRRIPDARQAQQRSGSIDYRGAVLATLGLAGVVWALVAGPEDGFTRPHVVAAGAGGAVLIVAFFIAERRAAAPLLPLEMFRSRQFSGANATTLLVYAALGGLFFFLMLEMQNVLRYSALAAGAALLPLNGLMLALSPFFGRLSHRIGPRLPMTIGALVTAGGMLLLSRVQPGVGYADVVLPGIIVFGLGLSAFVAPLTATVLAAVSDERTGVASAVNNAAARLAGLLAIAVLPLLAGLGGLDALEGPAFAAGYRRAMWISAALCVAGAAVAFLTIRRAAPLAAVAHPDARHGCT